jgi:hypothetical protein
MVNPAAPALHATLAFIPFVFSLSILFSAVLNNTDGSLLAVMTLHAAGDTVPFFLPVSAGA